MTREALTVPVEQAGRLLGISRSATYAAIRRGELRTVRVGRRVLIPKSELTRLVGGELDVCKNVEKQNA